MLAIDAMRHCHYPRRVHKVMSFTKTPLQHAPRLAVIHVVDSHLSTYCPHHLAAAPKMMHPWLRAAHNAPPSSVPGDQDLGSPLEQHEWVDARCNGDVFNKVTMHRRRCHIHVFNSSVFTGTCASFIRRLGRLCLSIPYIIIANSIW
jgi:hypothetical protein